MGHGKAGTGLVASRLMATCQLFSGGRRHVFNGKNVKTSSFAKFRQSVTNASSVQEPMVAC